MKLKYESPMLEIDSFDLSEYICRELYGDFYAAGRSRDVKSAGANWSSPTTTTTTPGGVGEGPIGGQGEGED